VRLLLVEDDAKLVRALERGLVREGFAVDVARAGDEALRMHDNGYDAVVLDVMLPGQDGFTVLEEIRRRDRVTPVLMLTARGQVEDRIRGLDGGADGYVVKPFDFDELVARLRALDRRSRDPAPQTIVLGDLTIDVESHVATRAGDRIDLTSRECAVLACLARRGGRVVPREDILASVWGEDFDGAANVVDVYVGYLRRKLDRSFDHKRIRTVRGVGFLLEPR